MSKALSKAAAALGRRAKGVPKTMTQAALEQRAKAREAKARKRAEIVGQPT